MPTLDDLRNAFDALADRAPAALPTPERPRSRRWVRPAVAAAACTAAAAVAVSYAIIAGNNPKHSARPASQAPAFEFPLSPPGPAQSPARSYGFAVTDPPGYVVTPDAITQTCQAADIRSTDGTVTGELYVFYAGNIEPSHDEVAATVTVNGRRGFYTPATLPGILDKPFEALDWEYADGAWATVDLHAAGVAPEALRADELAVATATHAAVAQLQVPMRISGIDGAYVESADGTRDGSGDVGLNEGTAPQRGDGSGNAWNINWLPRTLPGADDPGTPTVQIGGRTWIVLHDQSPDAISALGLVADGFGLEVVPADGSATLDQFRQFLAHVELAPDVTNQGTWFDAADALP